MSSRGSWIDKMDETRKHVDGRWAFQGTDTATSVMTFEESVSLSSRLSKLPIIGREQRREVIRMVPADVVQLLSAESIDFVLVGAHGVSGWMMEPRATQDVDLLIKPRDKTKTARCLMAKFTDLKIEKHPDVWRFGKQNQILIDLMLANTPLHKRVLTETDEVRIARTRVKIPRVECALVMKFAAMTGFYRKLAKKYIDAGDFASIVEKNKKLNLDLLHELGELHYPGGGAEIKKYVEDARAGKRMEI